MHACVLYTSTYRPFRTANYFASPESWEAIKQIATDLVIVSAVSVKVINPKRGYMSSSLSHPDKKTKTMVAVIARGRVYTTEGPFERPKEPAYEHGYDKPPLPDCSWQASTRIRVQHPGEVTGNPVLFSKADDEQFDLLVPFAEGGIFHFIRTPSTPIIY